MHERRIAEPLEQEVSRMKREKMPVRGGATPIYGDEDGEVFLEGDYHVGTLEMARNEISRVIRERMMEAKTPDPVLEPETSPEE